MSMNTMSNTVKAFTINASSGFIVGASAPLSVRLVAELNKKYGNLMNINDGNLINTNEYITLVFAMLISGGVGAVVMNETSKRYEAPASSVLGLYSGIAGGLFTGLTLSSNFSDVNLGHMVNIPTAPTTESVIHLKNGAPSAPLPEGIQITDYS